MKSILKRAVKAYRERNTMHLIISVANKRQTRHEKGRFIDGKLIKLSVISGATHPCRTFQSDEPATVMFADANGALRYFKMHNGG